VIRPSPRTRIVSEYREHHNEKNGNNDAHYFFGHEISFLFLKACSL
jgi:hypothetical protein